MGLPLQARLISSREGQTPLPLRLPWLALAVAVPTCGESDFGHGAAVMTDWQLRCVSDGGLWVRDGASTWVGTAAQVIESARQAAAAGRAVTLTGAIDAPINAMVVAAIRSGVPTAVVQAARADSAGRWSTLEAAAAGDRADLVADLVNRGASLADQRAARRMALRTGAVASLRVLSADALLTSADRPPGDAGPGVVVIHRPLGPLVRRLAWAIGGFVAVVNLVTAVSGRWRGWPDAVAGIGIVALTLALAGIGGRLTDRSVLIDGDVVRARQGWRRRWSAPIALRDVAHIDYAPGVFAQPGALVLVAAEHAASERRVVVPVWHTSGWPGVVRYIADRVPTWAVITPAARRMIDRAQAHG